MCPWKCLRNQRKDGLWTLSVLCDQHNHDPATELAGHPSVRRLTEDNEALVYKMTAAGVPTRQILTALRREDKGSYAEAKTVYNAKSNRRCELLGGAALVDELKETKFLHHAHCNTNGNIVRLFFAHPDSAALARRFNRAILLDCTYKSNRFLMPLLLSIGLTARNSSFSVAFAFLSEEDTPYYMWALKNLSALYDDGQLPAVIVTDADTDLEKVIGRIDPHARHLLCLWYIQKNVLKNSRKHIACGQRQEDS
ncbi:hypothetical protein PsorP6_019371 [Peronosclerospora sorghi]|nr:hypothetical protein PsorP6_019371 [Peronosclerospora sorghi]